jgi:RNA polymerase sigma-70 factor (ECF subfamily)
VKARSGRAPRIGTPFSTVLVGAQAGQQWAFERLYGGYAPAVAGYLRIQGGSDPDGLTNEVFFGAFSAITTFRGDEDGFRSWLFTIAHRRLTDDRRRAGRQPQPAGSGPDPEAVGGGDVEDEALRRLSVERVRSLCERLAPDQRDVLLLRMVAGLSIEQTAEALGKTETAIKALQRRALGAVRRIFDREGVSL